MSDGVLGELRAAWLAACVAALVTCAQHGPTTTEAARPEAARPEAARPEAARPEAAPPILDGVFPVGGGTMHLHCQGTGAPTVVFDSGSGNDGTAWGVIVSDISKVTRACTYDRMGLGYSSYGTKRTRTSQQMADELYGLLQAARLPGPYVLVAHSAGAWNQRLFAASHGREVAAMVLVEAATAGHYARHLSLLPPQALDAIKNRMRFIPDGWDFDSMLKSLDQVAGAPSLGDMPLVVLSRGQAGPPELPGVTPELQTQMFAAWTELQAELAKLSTNSAHVTAPKSGHMMLWEAYSLVVESILEAVRVAREGGRVDAARLAALVSP